MAKLLSLIPMLFSIFRRASVLRGITQSKTSQVQAGVLFAVCLLVAALGHFAPGLANNETATVIVSLIISIFGASIGRVIAFAEKKTNAPAESVWLVKINGTGDTWTRYNGTLADAQVEGAEKGVDIAGYEWDVKRGKRTGEFIPLDREAREQAKAIIAALVGSEGTEQ